MRGLVYMASRDKVDVDTFHKSIQYALEKLGKSKFGFERTAVSIFFKSKRHEGSRNELVDYSRAPCLGAGQKARGLWERDCIALGNHALLAQPTDYSLICRYRLVNNLYLALFPEIICRLLANEKADGEYSV